MYIVKMTQIGGMQEHRGTVRYFNGIFHASDFGALLAEAHRYETAAQADDAAVQLRKQPWMKAQQIDVVEV
jgi:hypothetical protein